jgi:hypothetical protein
MSQFKGFFALQKPDDLLAKLKHDYQRLQCSPMDTYAAFDFFVTGYHMLDWLYPDDKKRRDQKAKREQEEKDHVILQVCKHIANGIKHFRALDKTLKSISDTRVQEAAFQRDVFQENAFQVPALIVHLDGEAAKQFGPEVECVALARQVLQHWENHPGLK